jgi:hypothetical protein
MRLVEVEKVTIYYNVLDQDERHRLWQDLVDSSPIIENIAFLETQLTVTLNSLLEVMKGGPVYDSVMIHICQLTAALAKNR